MPHSVKYGDGRTLEWQLNRDLTSASGVTVIISVGPLKTPVISRAGTIEDAPTGLISLTLDPDTDYGDGLLEAGVDFKVEVEVEPGPITYPDCGWETLTICYDLG